MRYLIKYYRVVHLPENTEEHCTHLITNQLFLKNTVRWNNCYRFILELWKV